MPRLRRVSYELLFSQYRYLTDEEIEALYRSDSASLSRNEFWRLYNLADSIAEREAICRRALEVYPKFLVAATDLAAILIDKGVPDSELLLPYLEMPELPDETRLNQVVAWLSAGRYAQADSLAFDLPDTGIYHKAKVYAAALNGRYNEVMQEISAESPFNEVLMLLAIKSNEQAWEKRSCSEIRPKRSISRPWRLIVSTRWFSLCPIWRVRSRRIRRYEMSPVSMAMYWICYNRKIKV